MNRKGKKRFSSLVLICGFLTGIFLFISQAEAVQIKRVQKFTGSFDSDETYKSLSLTYSVDLNKTIILITQRHALDVAREGNCYVTPYFEDNYTVGLLRDYANAVENITGYVIEFNDGVKVYRGFTSMTDTTKEKYITLPETILNVTQRAFPIIYVRANLSRAANDLEFNETATVRATFTSDNVLYLKRNKRPSDAALKSPSATPILWQVVVFDSDIRIRQGNAQIPYNATSVTVDLSADPIVDINKALLFFSFTSLGGTTRQGYEGLIYPRATITDVNTLTFTRAASSTTATDVIDINWYLIEFTDNSSYVKKGSTDMAAGTTSLPVDLSPDSFDLTRAFPVISFSGGTAATNNYLDDIQPQADLSGSSTLTFTRGDGDIACNVDWFVVEGSPLTLKTPNGGEVWQVGDTVDITWKHADKLAEDPDDEGPATAHRVDLDLSIDGGASYPFNIVSGINGTLDTYAWEIPPAVGTDNINIIGVQLKIKITDTDLAQRNYDVSNANFKIRGKLSLNSPTSSSIWTIYKNGDTKPKIQWTAYGNLNDTGLSPNTMKIILITEGGYEHTLADTVDPGSHLQNREYEWQIPSHIERDPTGSGTYDNPIGAHNRIKIIHNYTSAGIMESISDEFTIKGQIFAVDITKQDDSPLDNNSCVLGQTYKIKWKKVGHFGSGLNEGQVRILYSTDGGLTYNIELTSATSAGTDSDGTSWSDYFLWTPTADSLKTNSAKIKVVQVGDETVYCILPATFKVSGGNIQISSPSAGALLKIGQTTQIAWTAEGSYENVDILLSRNNGGTWDLLGTVNKDGSPHDWIVGKNFAGDVLAGALASNQCLIKVVASTDSEVYALSDVFTLQGEIANVRYYDTNPSDWIVGHPCQIYWTSTDTLGDLQIFLSTNNGGTYSSIADNIPSTATSYTDWTVIPPLTTEVNKAKIKIVSKEFPSIYGTSETFDIVGTIYNVQIPADWKVGQACNVNWLHNYGDLNSTVNIYLSLNSGGSYPIQINPNPVNVNDHSFTGWIVTPPLKNNEARIKIQSTEYPEIYGISPLFSIVGYISNVKYYAGQTPADWKVGEPCYVSWSYDFGDTNSKVKLWLSRDSGGTYTTLLGEVLASAGSFDLWKVIPPLEDNEAKIKVESSDYPNDIYGLSETFSIVGAINVATPSGWKVGDDCSISWTSIGTFNKVDIWLSRNNGGSWELIGDDIDNTGGYTGWEVTPPLTTQALVKVQSADADTSSISGTCANNFSIAASITVIKPDISTGYWEIGTSQDIRWTYDGNFGNVIIELSRNNGGSWEPLATIPANNNYNTEYPDESYWTWTVTGPATAEPTLDGGIIRIKSESYPTYIISNNSANFEIRQAIKVEVPSESGITWTYGESRSIQYTLKGEIPYIDILYSKDGAPYQLLGPTAENIDTSTYPSSFLWPGGVPDAISNNIKIRVRDHNRPAVIYDDSDNPFKIRGIITVTQPEENELVKVTNDAGTNKKTIVWNVQGGVTGNATLKLSFDNGLTWPVTLEDGVVEPNISITAGSYEWTVLPSHLGANKVKVGVVGDDEDLAKNNVGASKTFKVVPYLEVTYPTGTIPPLYVGNTLYIKWTPKPLDLGASGSKVVIAYDTYGGLGPDGQPNSGDEYPDTNIITDPPINPDNIPEGETEIGYKWTIPINLSGIVGENRRLRVYQVGKKYEVYSEGSLLTIKGNVMLKGEANGEGNPVWKIGGSVEPKLIEWDVVGDVGDISIKYDKADGNGFVNTIVDSTSASSGAYLWNIPNDVIGNVDKNTNIKIKLQCLSPGLTDIYSISANPLTIQKQFLNLTVDAPTYPTLYVGEQNNITWITRGFTGTGALVYLFYDTNEGKGADGIPGTEDDYNNPINAGNPITDTGLGYLWTVDDAIGDKVRLRVRSAAYSDIYCDSPVNITIKGKIIPVYPTGTSTLVVGEPVQIQFNKKGSIGNLKIEYIHSGNATVITPEGGTPNLNSFEWIMTDLDSSGGNVIDTLGSKNSSFRFTSLTDNQPNNKADVANSEAFQVRGQIFDIEPSGDAVSIGQTVLIKWKTRGDVGNVRIRLDLNDGKGDDNTADTNDDYAVVVTGPAGNGEAVSCSPYTPGQVNSWQWQWTVPDSPTTKARIRVESIANPVQHPLENYPMATYGVSSANFRIQGSITVTTPNANTVWKVGDQDQYIDWTTTGSVGNVDILLLYDHEHDCIAPNPCNFAHVLPIATDTNIKPYPWDIPAGVTSDHAKIRITSHQDSQVTNDSEVFKIKPVITVTNPTDESEWEVGSAKYISWDYIGDVYQVKINLSTDGTTWSDQSPPDAEHKGGLIANFVSASDKSFGPWTVPDLMSRNCRIRITRVYEAGTVDSDTYDTTAKFDIKGYLHLISPNGNVELPVGYNTPKKTITWEYRGSLGTVNLYYMPYADQPNPQWEVINTEPIPVSQGSFEWDPIPAKPSNILIRVQSSPSENWMTVYDDSDNYNQIIGSIVLVDPKNQIIEVGGQQIIRWTPNGYESVPDPKFRIEYKYSDAVGWVEISPSAGVSGTIEGTNRTWLWNPQPDGIPDTISNSVYFRVSDYNVSKVKGENTEQDKNIIRGKLDVVKPDGTEVWNIGTQKNIEWQKKGSIGDLIIDYSTSGSFAPGNESYIHSITIWPSESSPYAWNIPVNFQNISETCVIRLRSGSVGGEGTELTAYSPQFKIR
ncbi:MAG: GPI anchored serine-threonine rich family protein, partial [Candidatus Omnitrophica bacterium]|nr:GPI anchored serine-threonine rich family protein [Candidatus Omnitrophota bacterium]